ncbi:13941_t:CDS:2 [Acaulospora morrowiae]|uniref:13941_t:CDS:1 n=1 Tax=Acaulospora morrowiae TaxID=94023 RepID=A0A9N9C0D1_9GLOM|nr:13941_t:CDS:2 [Acaulospora morrowiae]
MCGLRCFTNILRPFILLLTSIVPIVVAECIFDQGSYSCFKITQLASSLPNLIVGLIPDGSLDSDTGAPWLTGMTQAIFTGLVPRSWTVANTGVQGWLDKDLAEIKAGRNFVTVFEAEELLIRENHFLDAHSRYGMACFSIGLNNYKLRYEKERWTTVKLRRLHTKHAEIPLTCGLTCQKLRNKICKDLYGVRLLVFRKIFYVTIMIIDTLAIVIAWTALWCLLSLDVQIKKNLTFAAMILSQILGFILLVGTAVLADYEIKKRTNKIVPCRGGESISYLERWDYGLESPELVFIYKLKKSATGKQGKEKYLVDVALKWSKFLCNKEQKIAECLEHSKEFLDDESVAGTFKFRLQMLSTENNECPCRVIMRSLLRALIMCSDKFLIEGERRKQKLIDDKHINSCFTPLPNPLHDDGCPQLLGRRTGVNKMTHNHSGTDLEIPIVAWCTFWKCRRKKGKDIIASLGIVIGIIGILSGLFLQLFTDEYGIWVGAAFSICGLILSPLRTFARNMKSPHYQINEQGNRN